MLLLFSWAVCWYFFCIRYNKPPHTETRASHIFTVTSYAVFCVLIVWSLYMWLVPPAVPRGWILLVAASLTLGGQWGMCAARKELPLSTYQVVMRILPMHINTGIYGYFTHPMYIGLLAALLGSALVLDNEAAVGALVLLLPVLAVRAWAEEGLKLR